jgi:hypothetical protein
MPSTPRAPGRGARRMGRWPRARRLHLALAGLLLTGVIGLAAAQAGATPQQPLPPHFPPQPTQTPNWPPPHWPPPNGPPQESPPPESPPPEKPPAAGGGQTPTAQVSSGGIGGVAGAHASGHSAGHTSSGGSPEVVVVKPAHHPGAKHHVKKTQEPKAVVPPAPAPVLQNSAPASPGSNPARSTFADRLLSPGEIDLSAENLGEGGLLAFLLAALLYLPVTIFNKATEKNHEMIKGWFARPRAWLAALFGWIPVSRHPGLTLTGGALASAALFAFIEPGFPTEQGALEYLIGMMIGFAVVSVVFFATWRIVLKRLEPDGEGEWRIFPPYILLAAFLVVMARLAHFIPGVVLGTVAEYEPAKRLSVRTAGIRVATTYGALIVLGLAAWFAWVPIEHAAAKEGASSLTLILDSALAITFVSALESVAFGLIPMTFLDGNDLFRWHKGLWATMWGGALVWFSVVIMHPALSTYQEHGHARLVWFVLLFSTLMVLALATWALFRIREARASAAAS